MEVNFSIDDAFDLSKQQEDWRLCNSFGDERKKMPFENLVQFGCFGEDFDGESEQKRELELQASAVNGF